MRKAIIVATAMALAACAANQREAKTTSKAPAEAPRQVDGAPSPAMEAKPADTEKAASPAPAPPSTPTSPTATAQGASQQTRTVAMSQASNEIEAAQRELDVAGGDCRNACRALGSMDRAAGRICSLASSNDEQRRCGDAKTRVYSARDKVKNTCGTCPDVSVDRSAPIPSR